MRYLNIIIILKTGLSLYFALPRHTFNDVQRVLFPRYFTINACLSFITLVIFVKHHPFHTWDTEIATQVSFNKHSNTISIIYLAINIIY